MYNTTVIRFSSCTIRNNQGLHVLSASALIIAHVTKTLSNNFLLKSPFIIVSLLVAQFHGTFTPYKRARYVNLNYKVQ